MGGRCYDFNGDSCGRDTFITSNLKKENLKQKAGY